MNLTDEMKTIRANIDAAQEERTARISEIQKETREIQKDAREMQKKFRKEHHEMAAVLRRDLESYVTGIKKSVQHLLGDARAQQKEVAKDIAGMHEAWTGKAPAKKVKEEKKESKKK